MKLLPHKKQGGGLLRIPTPKQEGGLLGIPTPRPTTPRALASLKRDRRRPRKVMEGVDKRGRRGRSERKSQRIEMGGKDALFIGKNLDLAQRHLALALVSSKLDHRKSLWVRARGLEINQIAHNGSCVESKGALGEPLCLLERLEILIWAQEF